MDSLTVFPQNLIFNDEHENYDLFLKPHHQLYEL